MSLVSFINSFGGANKGGENPTSTPKSVTPISKISKPATDAGSKGANETPDEGGDVDFAEEDEVPPLEGEHDEDMPQDTGAQKKD